MKAISFSSIDRRSFGIKTSAKPISERNPVYVALVGLAILAVISLVVFFSGDLPIVGGTGYTAYFAEAAGLQPGNEVRIAGVVWVGNQTTGAIDIKTVLGDKYLALDPVGGAPQDPGTPIPVSRTTSPYDVTQAFGGFGEQVSKINTAQLAESLRTLSAAFSTTPPYVRSALRGLADLSRSVASKDTEVTSLLASAKQVTGTLAGEDARFTLLLRDGNLLLAELQLRRESIHALFIDTQALATQLSGLVNDNQAALEPALQALNQVTSVLQADQNDLARALALAAPYYRLLGNALGNGRWFDAYVCGLIPHSYVPANTPAHGCQPPKP